jgi:hypothetical protein
MPTVTKSQATWDLNVVIRSDARISRLISLNHPIGVQFAAENTYANVQLASSVDRQLVPCKDFVLLFRDKAMESTIPNAIAAVGPSGHQAISMSVIPDFRPVKVQMKNIRDDSVFAQLGAKGIDLDPANVYSKTEPETEEESKDEQEVVFVEPKQNEYIFLIDRSGSMYNTINLARQALQLFLQSLTYGSSFQIVSYGSEFEFLFKDRRSVDYNDENFKTAFDAVSTFEADFGGTEILQPLEAIFKLQKPRKD